MIRVCFLLLLFAPVAWAHPHDELCLRCERFGSQFTGGADLGTPPAVAYGCYSGNGVDDRLIETGFRPTFVMVREVDNSNTNGCAWRFDAHSLNLSCGNQTDGVDNCIANQIQSYTDTGFILGTESKVNQSPEPYCYLALSTAPGYIVAGSYTGNGDSSRTLETPFAPDAVLIFSRNAGASTLQIFLKVLDMGSLGSVFSRNQAEAWVSDYVTAINAATDYASASITIVNGVAAGEANTLGVTYDYLLFDEQSGAVDAGVYTGDGETEQAIPTTCSTIEALFVRSNSNNPESNASWRTKAMETDLFDDIETAWSAQCGNSATEPGGIVDLVDNVGTFSVSSVGDISLNDDGIEYAFLAICAGQVIQTTAAEDWTSSFTAVWDFEEAAGMAATNATGTICGADCDMADSNGVGRSTTEIRHGEQSADLNGSNDFFSCAAAACETGDGDLKISDSASWGCWVRTTSDGGRYVALGAGNDGTNNRPLWRLSRENAFDRQQCGVTTGADVLVEASGATDGWEINEWNALSCTWDNDADLVTAYRRAVVSGSSTAAASLTAASLSNAAIGRNDQASLFFPGQIDECWLYPGVLTVTQMCRIFSCGVDGASCLCNAADPTKYVDQGNNASIGNCTLPLCNAAAP
jgi:hypothetical protein